MPDAVLALARGGLACGRRARLCARREEHGDAQRRVLHRRRRAARRAAAAAAGPDLSLLRTERLLVVDDVADTGRTLALARDFCAEHVGDVRTAVLYEKPQSVVTSDFVWRWTDPLDQLPLEHARWRWRRAVKVFIVSDMEGVAGIVKWQQTDGTKEKRAYHEGRELYTEEINAAVRGAKAAGATRSSSWTATAPARSGRSTR